MADSIEEISEKYIVLKRDDVKKYLSTSNADHLYRILSFMARSKEGDGKPRSNEYLVLNMADNFKVSVFYKEMSKVIAEHPRKVRDYAVAFVNTVQYSKK